MKKICILLFTFVFFIATPTFAQQQESAIRVSPVIINVDLSPGKEYFYDVTITNISKNPLPVTLSFDTFDTDESGNEFTFSSPTQNSLLSWVSVDTKDLLIPANSKKNVKLKISLPSKIPLGGYYGVLFVEPVLSKIVHGSQVSAKVGVLMLANIGVTDKKNTIEVVQSQFDKSFYTAGPVNHLLRIKNTTLSHFSTKPELIIEPLFGNPHHISLEEKIIFPGKIRKWNTSFELPDYYHGFYKTTLAISTGKGKQVLVHSYIIAFPFYVFLFTLLAFITLLTSIIYRKRIRKALRILFSKE